MWGLSPAEKLDLASHAPALRAEESLYRHAEKMTADELYEAVLTATGSKAQAEEMMAARIAAELKAGLKPSAK